MMVRTPNIIQRKIKKWENYIKRYEPPFQSDIVRVKVIKIREFIDDLNEILYDLYIKDDWRTKVTQKAKSNSKAMKKTLKGLKKFKKPKQ